MLPLGSIIEDHDNRDNNAVSTKDEDVDLTRETIMNYFNYVETVSEDERMSRTPCVLVPTCTQLTTSPRATCRKLSKFYPWTWIAVII